MTSVNKSSETDQLTLNLEQLKEFIDTLQAYANLLKKENEAITKIEAQSLLEIVEEKKRYFDLFETKGQLIDLIFAAMNSEKKTPISNKLINLARNKAFHLIDFIQKQGRVNHQLLQSLDLHTKNLLGNLSGVSGNETYENIKRGSQRH